MARLYICYSFISNGKDELIRDALRAFTEDNNTAISFQAQTSTPAQISAITQIFALVPDIAVIYANINLQKSSNQLLNYLLKANNIAKKTLLIQIEFLRPITLTYII